MVFKVSQYRAGKEDLIQHVRKNNCDFSSISYYCAVSYFPVAAALVFCIEEWPEKSEELEKKLGIIKEFYGYEGIER